MLVSDVGSLFQLLDAREKKGSRTCPHLGEVHHPFKDHHGVRIYMVQDEFKERAGRNPGNMVP